MVELLLVRLRFDWNLESLLERLNVALSDVLELLNVIFLTYKPLRGMIGQMDSFYKS